MADTEQISNHQVKVDNWPLFFLQRLHHFYRKKSHCDLTLLFSTFDTVKSVKVHKLVLHACTDYFESLDVMTDSEHGEFLQLSNEMQPDVVIPIISFMYTGKLEFPVSLQPRLYEAATKLRMTILTKLLDVQPTKVSQKSVPSSCEEALMKVSSSVNEASLAPSQMAIGNQDTNFSDKSSHPRTKNTENSVITLMPASVVLPQKNQNSQSTLSLLQSPELASTKTDGEIKSKIVKKNVGLQLASANSKTKVVVVSLPPTMPGRKLPVWKRKVPLAAPQFLSEDIQNVRGNFRTPEKAKPTRFEWEDDLNDPTSLKPVEDALKILSYDGGVKINHPIILEEDSATQCKDSSFDSLRKSSDDSSFESPPNKRSKSDLQDMKEYGKQQQLRNEIICSEENEDDLMDADDLYGPCDDESDDLTNFNLKNVNASTPKPILKTVFKPEPPSACKKVRFSLEGKENQTETDNVEDFTLVATTSATASPGASSTAITAPSSPAAFAKTFPSVADKEGSDSVKSKQKIVLPLNMNQIQSGKHHVKIVSEVLKKYPNLAKKENIKLRVVSKNPAAVPPTVQQAVEGETGAGNKSSSSLVSYIFLTNKSSGDLLPVKNEQNDKDKVFDVENKAGPWFCQVCDEVNPIEFDSYYAYRRHLVEVHELKIDARICEYCGLKNSKRNHLLYHLYTKHKIEPPAHVSFPKCSECDYVALSDALLIKHKGSHDPKGLTCYTCNVVFKSYSSLQIHLQSSWHKNKVNDVSVIVLSDYPCPFCEARFRSGSELKDHIESCHHSQLQYADEADDSNAASCAENPPSSELESLSNVASGIATSLSLVGNEQTVIYYEHKNDEGQVVGREATVIGGDECRDFIKCRQQEVAEDRSVLHQCKIKDDESITSVTIENEDSNSRMSSSEEINRTSCSDHDYTESQGGEQISRVIPVTHQVGNQIGEGTVIQQIIPEQSLVFSNEGNVVFQSPCVSLPPRVLVTSGKVVLPHGDQNLILSQVIPQAPIILSSPIVQQSGGILDDRDGALVFANSTVVGATDSTSATPTMSAGLESIHTAVEFTLEQATEISEENVERLEEIEDQDSSEKNCNGEQIGDEADKCEVENGIKNNDNIESGEKASVEGNEDEVENNEENLEVENSKNRVETSKIVDDWDETNDCQQNVENRSDGPRRPDFL